MELLASEITAASGITIVSGITSYGITSYEVNIAIHNYSIIV